MRSLLRRWTIGGILGTLIIAITSPLFVRSYLPRSYDSVRRVQVLQPGNLYRWRSEGYAATAVGPHGMPGRVDIPSSDANTLRVAVWGDSQAEGVCVNDESKLHNQIEIAGRELGIELTVFPLARSGDDASNWLRQIPGVEEELDIGVHMMFVVELADLHAAADPHVDAIGTKENSAIAGTFPAFVIHAGRRLLTDADRQPRRLRFSIGPTEASPEAAARAKPDIPWGSIVKRLDDATSVPLVIVYAPVLPNITDGSIRSDDPDDSEFVSLRHVAERAEITVIDVRDAMRKSVDVGEWPHGFHHGRIGSGHLNRTGYRIISRQVAEVLRDVKRQD